MNTVGRGIPGVNGRDVGSPGDLPGRHGTQS